MAVERFEYKVAPFQDGRAFGEAGAFERITGDASFAIDPSAPAMAAITDLHLVPVDADGKVRFRANFSILRPVDPARRNGRAYLDLPNRGGVRLMRNTNVAEPPPFGSPIDDTADGWILRQGYSVLGCGWQHDAPEFPGALRADVPEALIDGERIRGTVICHLEAFHPSDSIPIGHYGHRPYEVADPDGATLRVRDYVDGPPTLIARENWAFAKDVDGAVRPDAGHVWLSGGFEPGKLYELQYEAVGAVPTALGLVGVRDFLSHLRFADERQGNPCAGDVAYVYGFGGSQPGGVLRLMSELDLFRDETGRPVLDGYIAHGAGAFKSEGNWRFGQLSPFGPRTPGFVPPFDCRPIPGQFSPKAVYSIAGPDYWDLFGSLCHTAPGGTADLVLGEDTRILYLAGQPHVRGAVADVSGTSMILHPVNTLDFGPFLRAAIVNLDLWVREGVPFPPSRMPTLAKGTLVERSQAVAAVKRATGHPGPLHPAESGLLDFGPRSDQRILDHPAQLKETYPTLICDVDADGNDRDGLLHPEVAVPLATYAPWNIREEGAGAAGEGTTLVGAMIPFAVEGPLPEGDTRSPISDRYASRQDYLDQVRGAAQALIADRMMLAEDEDIVVEVAGKRWDRVHEAWQGHSHAATA